MKILVRSIAIVAVLVVAGTCALSLFLRGTFVKDRSAAEAGGTPVEVGLPGHHIYGREYLVGPSEENQPLIVVLHGDAPAIKPSYQYVFARIIAKAVPGAHVVGLLRPGYADPFGAKSDGDHGLFATADNYSPRAISDLAAAIQDLKDKFKPSKVIVVGHSGGAALTADIAAENPGLIQQAFLVGCPCDVPAFRKHMAKAQRSPFWLLPVRSVSPMDTLNRMTAATTIRAITGANDQIALPVYAQKYVEKAQALKVPASVRILPNSDHEILLSDEVIAEVTAAAK